MNRALFDDRASCRVAACLTLPPSRECLHTCQARVDEIRRARLLRPRWWTRRGWSPGEGKDRWSGNGRSSGVVEQEDRWAMVWARNAEQVAGVLLALSNGWLVNRWSSSGLQVPATVAWCLALLFTSASKGRAKGNRKSSTKWGRKQDYEKIGLLTFAESSLSRIKVALYQ